MPPKLPWFPPGVFRRQQYAVSLAPERSHARLEVEAELNGRGNGWTDLTADLVDDPGLSIEYGIPDTGPTALVATSGEMRFALQNFALDGRPEGYYSPGHVSCRPGFRVGIRVRFTMLINGTTYRKHVGWLSDIEPIAGRYRERKTLCTSLDWMDQAAKSNPTIATQANRTSGQVVAAEVAAVPQLPEATSIAAGDSTFAFSLDNSQNENGSALNELARCAQSEPGFIYCKGDGTLVFEARSARYAPTPFATFNETTQGMTVTQALNQLRNRVKITTHPRRVDPGTSVLATNQGAPSIAAGETRRFTLYYTNPANRAERCGGTGIIAPVSGTDYTAGFVVSIVGVAGANSIDLDVTNPTGAAATLSLLQVRGSYLLDQDPIDSVVLDQASIQTYGETRFIQDMPYQSDSSVAGVVASNILSVWANPQVNEVTLQYIPPDDAALEVALAVEPGTCLGVVESITGVDGNFYVQHVSIRAMTDKVFQFEWLCQRAAAQPFVTGRTQSGQSTNVTTHVLSLPSGIEVDELLIAVFVVDQIPVITWPGGWTVLGEMQSPALSGTVSVAYRLADGTEGSSISITTDSAQQSSHISYRIAGAETPAVRAPEIAGVAVSGGYPDCPLLVPTGGVKNYLWLAIAGWNDSGAPVLPTYITAVPVNYSNATQQGSTGNDGWGAGIAERIYRAASEDPGGFTLNNTAGWVAFTVAIHPKA